MNNRDMKLPKPLLDVAEKFAKAISRRGISMEAAKEEDLRALYARTEKTEAARSVNAYVISLWIVIIVLSAVFTLLCVITRRPVVEEGAVVRPDSGGGAETVTLEVEAYGPEDSQILTDYSLSVNEVRLYGEDLELMFGMAVEYIDTAVLGENESLEEVTKPLMLVTSVPGTSIRLEWSREDPSLINRDGSLNNSDISEAKICILTVKMQYFDEERIYEFPARILPAQRTAEEELLEYISEAVGGADKESEGEKRFVLPTEYRDGRIIWHEKKDLTPWYVLGLGIICAFAVIPMYRMEIKRKISKRAEQIEEDYPGFVSRFTLLLSAGMTARGAFIRLSDEYLASVAGGKNEKRYLGEEMVVATNELALGVSECDVYEHFGKACGTLCCRRFGNIVSGGVKRGSRAVLESLEKEAKDIMAESLLRAKEKGERLGTRLLIPMIGLLGVVIAIIVVPAFKSF